MSGKHQNDQGQKGQDIVEGLENLVSVLESGQPLESQFTVRTYRITPPPEFDAEAVRLVRSLLSMSQAAFSAFLGIDTSTVRSWEQGTRKPSPLARRILSEIEAEPEHWRRRLTTSLSESKTTEPQKPTLAKKRTRKPSKAP